MPSKSKKRPKAQTIRVAERAINNKARIHQTETLVNQLIVELRNQFGQISNALTQLDNELTKVAAVTTVLTDYALNGELSEEASAVLREFLGKPEPGEPAE